LAKCESIQTRVSGKTSKNDKSWSGNHLNIPKMVANTQWAISGVDPTVLENHHFWRFLGGLKGADGPKNPFLQLESMHTTKIRK